MKWHAIRVTYGRELKFQTVLQQAGYETFVPMVMKSVAPGAARAKANATLASTAATAPTHAPATATTTPTHAPATAAALQALKPTQTPSPAPVNTSAPKPSQTKLLVPAVSNLLFVRAEQNDLYDFFKGMGENCPARFIWDKTTRNPITVPDKAMTDFITVSNAMLEDTIYLTELNSTLREGQKVRVLAGPFAGVEGRIVRIRRSRRILVELPGMLAIAAIFIPSDNLEIIH